MHVADAVEKLPKYPSPRISSEINDCSLPLTFDTYSKCSMHCEYCVPEGTLITMVDGTLKYVEDINCGEFLLGYNEDTKQPEVTVVEKTMTRKSDHYISFILDNSLFYTTKEHPIFTQRGWVNANELIVGDLVLVHNRFEKDKINRKTIELIFHRELEKGISEHRNPLYPIWNMMVQRCHYPTNERFVYYGARGIQVCLEWRDSPTTFFAWAENNGYVTGLEIDRIDNDGDYTPENCRFVSHKVNSANRRRRTDNTSGYIGVRKTDSGAYRNDEDGISVSSIYRCVIDRETKIKGTNKALNFPRIPFVGLIWKPIEYIRTHNKDVTVYNFECWPHNNYFAGNYKQKAGVSNYSGVLLHNCFSSVQKCNTPGASTAPLQAVDVRLLQSMIDGTANKGSEPAAFHEFFFKNRFIFHWGGLSDPNCMFEKKFGIGYKVLEILAERRYPTLFSFKGGTIMEDKYLKLFDDHKHFNSFAFQLSIVTADDQLAKTLERGVPSPTNRFRVMKTVSDMGYWTVLRLRPYIIGVTDRSIDEILQKGLDSGMNAISTEFYAMENRLNPQAMKQYEIMAKLMHIKNLPAYFRKLSPSERGSYKRLNRHVKEPYIKKLYEFCAKHNLVFGCSDPDFKELSTTPCCCALPEEHPDNPEFNNYLRQQLTWAMVEARREYHRTGNRKILTFGETYGTNESFLDNIELSHQNYGCTMHNYAYRKQLTTRHIIQAQWNTLSSPASPSRYFHGKVMPIGLDDTGENLAYRYCPSEYEERWAAQGIDLTR